MNKVIDWIVAMAVVALILLIITLTAHADGDVYVQGTDLTKAVSCTDATAREDGAALTASEISRVEIGFTQNPDVTSVTPQYFMQMPGGCQTKQFDLSLLTVGQWYEIGWTVDTDGKYSQPSAPFPFVYQAQAKARPDAPAVTK